MARINLTSIDELQAILKHPDTVLADTRYDLKDKQLGYQAYLAGHIPGAIYIDLADDLSDFEQGVSGGRHPLPKREDFAKKLGQKGIGNQSRVVIYDDHGGMYAARLWWMLRWLGHEHVTLLDGGLSAWIKAGRALETSDVNLSEIAFELKDPLQKWISQSDVEQRLNRIGTDVKLIDVRAPERYRGDVEPLDAKAGHIPGAINRPFTDNIAQSLFKSPEQLQADFQALEIETNQENIVYCGSGVTACQQILAMELAGIPNAKLYGGSWSEWSQNH